VLSIKFHNPDFPDDIVFGVGGIAIPNGTSVELDYDAELSFYARHGKKIKDYFADNDYVEINGTTELDSKDYDNYPSSEEEVSSVVLVDTEEGDPTVPETETDPDTGVTVVVPEEGEN
jgi:hypothetical protein